MSNFTIAPFTYHDIGRTQRSIAVSVVGFWSRDPITIYCQRGWSEKREWKFSLSVSSGGRDTDVIKSDADAYINYGEALVAAAMVIKDLEANVDAIEAGYQEYVAELEAERARLDAEKQAKIDADLPFGNSRAVGLIASLLADGRSALIKTFERGQDRPGSVSLVVGAKSVFYINTRRVGKADAVAYLAKCSARSALVEAQ